MWASRDICKINYLKKVLKRSFDIGKFIPRLLILCKDRIFVKKNPLIPISS